MVVPDEGIPTRLLSDPGASPGIPIEGLIREPEIREGIPAIPGNGIIDVQERIIGILPSIIEMYAHLPARRHAQPREELVLSVLDGVLINSNRLAPCSPFVPAVDKQDICIPIGMVVPSDVDGILVVPASGVNGQCRQSRGTVGVVAQLVGDRMHLTDGFRRGKRGPIICGE